MTLRHGRRRRDGHERLGLLVLSCVAFPVDAVGVVGRGEDDGTCARIVSRAPSSRRGFIPSTSRIVSQQSNLWRHWFLWRPFLRFGPVRTSRRWRFVCTLVRTRERRRREREERERVAESRHCF